MCLIMVLMRFVRRNNMIGFVIWSLLGVFIIYGIIFVILGIPLLDDQNTPYVLLSVIGVMVETIVIMAAYSLVIVKKYE